MKSQAVERACREAGLAEHLHPIVESLLDNSDESWRACCGKGCQPCSLTLGLAVDRARAILRGGAAADGPSA